MKLKIVPGWKPILLQVIITFAAVWGGLRFFSSNDVERWQTFQNVLSEQTQLLEDKLNTIESMLDEQQHRNSRVSDQSSRLTKNPKEINESLTSIIERLVHIEGRIRRSATKKPPIGAVPPNANALSRMPGATDPTAWIRELPEAKRDQVEEIFKKNHDAMRKKILNGVPPNREAMRALRDENTQSLKEALKAVLDENEYRKFLESLPKPPNVELPPLPAAPK